MRERLEKRLQDLTAEFESGQQMLADLEARQAALRDTLLRISGAITVLKEELEADQNGEVAPQILDGAVSAADRV
jgi:predicted nuclease with TOPRIM domain